MLSRVWVEKGYENGRRINWLSGRSMDIISWTGREGEEGWVRFVGDERRVAYLIIDPGEV